MSWDLESVEYHEAAQSQKAVDARKLEMVSYPPCRADAIAVLAAVAEDGPSAVGTVVSY